MKFIKHLKVESIWDKSDSEFTGSVIDDNGNIAYYLDGKLHRIDEPAIEWSNGDKEWFLHGELHRLNGPAKEYTTHHYIEWSYHGKFISDRCDYTLEEFQKAIIDM